MGTHEGADGFRGLAERAVEVFLTTGAVDFQHDAAGTVVAGAGSAVEVADVVLAVLRVADRAQPLTVIGVADALPGSTQGRGDLGCQVESCLELKSGRSVA